MNKDRLIKLLNLTTSDNDHEALSAIRSVNKLLKQNNQMWDDVIREGISVRVEYVNQYQQTQQRPQGTYEEPMSGFADYSKQPTDQRIRELLAFCMGKLRGKHNRTAKFIDSLNEYYKKHGTLSAKQYKTLGEIALDLHEGKRR